jgi:stage II sporulation protein AA (anti-sigma F factor antagonist)
MQDSAKEGMAFRLEVAVRQGIATIRLSGELDMSRTARLDEACAALFGEPVSTTRVDASGITFIDCAGLRSLLVIAKEMERRGGTLVVVQASAPVRRLLELSGFEILLEEAPSSISDSELGIRP